MLDPHPELGTTLVEITYDVQYFIKQKDGSKVGPYVNKRQAELALFARPLLEQQGCEIVGDLANGKRVLLS